MQKVVFEDAHDLAEEAFEKTVAGVTDRVDGAQVTFDRRHPCVALGQKVGFA